MNKTTKLEDKNEGTWHFDNCECFHGTLNKEDNGIYYLEISTDQPDIELIDKLLESSVSIVTRNAYGTLKTGVKISLFNINLLNMSTTATKTDLSTTQKYQCKWICIGDSYCKSIDETKIQKLKAQYYNFNAWFQQSFSKDHMKKNNETGDIEEIDKQEPIFELEINRNCSDYKIGFNQNGVLEFSFNSPTNLLDSLKELQKLTDFLILCYGEITTTESIRFIDENKKEFELIIPDKNKGNISKLFSNDFFIQFSFIKDNFQSCYKKWLDTYELWKPTIAYFVESHERTFHIPISFLKIVQALEVFSRRTRKNIILDEEDFSDLKKRLENDIKNENDKKLVLKLLSNEPRLRQRLKDLFKEVDCFFEISSRKRDSLAFKISQTRNYYTHFDISHEDKKCIYNNEQIFYVSQYMKFVLKVLLLKEINVDDRVIANQLVNDQEYITAKKKLDL
ncbi:MAG: hypothetical protein IJX07_05695 [Bacillales bacterium]|nr:hypothetical protein [Bacillales bacterium]